MTNWKEYKLNDLVTKLGDGLHGTPKYDPNGDYYFINGSNLIDGKISVNDKTKRVTKQEYDKYKKELSDRTIFVSINGTLGNIATYNNEKVVLGKSACYFNVKEDVSKEFIKYIVTDKTFQHYIYEYATGTTIKNVPLKAIREYSFKLPDYDTQTAIAEILASLDDKIELNNKINQELENLAQTLFKQWFIDFEFPANLADSTLSGAEGYKSSGGEMVESELGEIPKGWEVGILNDILEVKGGTTPSTKNPLFWNGEFHWTSPRDLSNLQFPLLLNTDKKITKEGLKKISSGLLPKGTLLLSSRAPIGYLAISEIETAINQGYIAINAKKGFSNLYLLYWIKSNMELIIERANGSTFLEISKTNFKQINCLIPSATILNEYVNQIEILFEQLRINLLENQELTNLRDTLLPKLISGELEVAEVNGQN